MISRSPLRTKPLRSPGQSLDEEIARLLDDKIFAYVFVAGGLVVLALMEWWAVIMDSPRQPIWFTCAAVIAVAITIVQVIRIRPRIRRLKLGRDGERLVGQFLEERRNSGAQVLHDIPGDGFNLDHIVISDRGVVVVETKTISKPAREAVISFDRDQLLIAGRKPDRDPLEQARAQVAWLKGLLKESTGKHFPVRAALVYPGWWVERVPESIRKDLWVLNPKSLPAFLEYEQVQLTPEDVALAAFHLKQYVKAKI